MANRFLDGTKVRRAAPERYTATIDPVWNLRPLPQGGLVTALALRAMAAELDDPGQVLRVLHTTFAAQVADGPVDIAVEVLRRGRSMSHLRAEVANVGAARGHLTTAIFGGPREGFAFTDLEPPADRPAPVHCQTFRDPPPPEVEPFPPMPFWDEVVEGRNVSGHPPWEDYEPDRAERVTWYRFDEAPFRDDGVLDPFALVVLADIMPGAVGEKLGAQERMWFAPSVDLTFHLLDDCRSPWVLARSRCSHAGDGYASADASLWDCGPDGRGEPRLVATASQVMLFTFLS